MIIILSKNENHSPSKYLCVMKLNPNISSSSFIENFTVTYVQSNKNLYKDFYRKSLLS